MHLGPRDMEMKMEGSRGAGQAATYSLAWIWIMMSFSCRRELRFFSLRIMNYVNSPEYESRKMLE